MNILLKIVAVLAMTTLSSCTCDFKMAGTAEGGFMFEPADTMKLIEQ